MARSKCSAAAAAVLVATLMTMGAAGETEKFIKDRKEALANGGMNLVFYGDSILQCLRFEAGACGGAIDVGQRRFSKYHYSSFAVGNESPTTMLQRMKAGAVPVDVNQDPITVAAIMIGHHGLGTGQTVAEVEQMATNHVKNITDSYEYLMSLDPKIHVLSIGLIPGTGSDNEYVRSAYYTSTETVNKKLKEYAAENSDKVTFANCTGYFLRADDPTKSNATLLYDGVHMSKYGFERFADCLEPYLDHLLAPVIENKEPRMMMDNATLQYSSSEWEGPSPIPFSPAPVELIQLPDFAKIKPKATPFVIKQTGTPVSAPAPGPAQGAARSGWPWATQVPASAPGVAPAPALPSTFGKRKYVDAAGVAGRRRAMMR